MERRPRLDTGRCRLQYDQPILRYRLASTHSGPTSRPAGPVSRPGRRPSIRKPASSAINPATHTAIAVHSSVVNPPQIARDFELFSVWFAVIEVLDYAVKLHGNVAGVGEARAVVVDVLGIEVVRDGPRTHKIVVIRIIISKLNCFIVFGGACEMYYEIAMF